MKTLTADEAAALIREMRANRIAFANGQIAQKKKTVPLKNCCRLNWTKIRADKSYFMRELKLSPLSALKMAVRTEKVRRDISKFYGHLNNIDVLDKKDKTMAKDKKAHKGNKMDQTVNERETKPLQDSIEAVETDTKSIETEAAAADVETAKDNKTDTAAAAEWEIGPEIGPEIGNIPPALKRPIAWDTEDVETAENDKTDTAAEKISEALKRSAGYDKKEEGRIGRATADFMRGLLSGDNPGASLNWVFGFVDNLGKDDAKEYAEYKEKCERKHKFAMATLDAIVNYLNDLPDPETDTNAGTQAVSKKLEEMSISEVKAWIIDRLKAQTDGAIKLNTDKIPEFHSLKEFCVFASRPDAQQPQHMAAMLSLLGDYLKTKPQTLSDGCEMLARMLVSTDVRVIYQRDKSGAVLDNDPEIIVNL